MSGFLISFPGGSLVQVVLGLELFHTSASVSELLLSCKEWMARWANVRSDFFLYGLCHKCVTACASYFTFLVVRMDSFLHAIHLFPAQVYHLCIIICWIQYHSSFSVSYAHLNFNGFFDVMRFWYDSFEVISVFCTYLFISFYSGCSLPPPGRDNVLPPSQPLASLLLS